MQHFFKQIFEYHSGLNNELIDYFEQHQEGVTPEMHYLFCHMLNAHQVWNSRILRTPSFGVFQRHEPGNYREINTGNTELSLNILHTYPLTDTISYTDTEGHPFVNTIGEVMFHIGNHHTHHRGQIMKLLREAGLDPLITDFIYTSRRPLS